MGILKKFNLFKKKEYNIGIIRFGDNIVIPGRDYFKDNSKLEKLEEIKKHYIDELSKRSAVTTASFNSNELKDNMNMNIDLVLRVVFDNEDFYLYAPEELIIQSAKLKMYYEEITNLEEETIMRLIALKEIEKQMVLEKEANNLEEEIIIRLISLKEIKKTNRIPKHNRMALEEEINKLSVILEKYSYRKGAINIELKNYFDVLSTKDLNEQDENIYEERLNKLLYITDGIIDTNEIDNYSDIRVKIAILERKCEKYCYKNKDEIINIISNKFNYLDNFDAERKLNLFNIFTNNINENDIKKYYKLKFYMNAQNSNKFAIKESDLGFNYYKEIVSDILNEIFTNKGNVLTFTKNEFQNLKNILKNKESNFDLEEILLNKDKLDYIYAYLFIESLSTYYNDYNEEYISLNNVNKILKAFYDKYDKQLTKLKANLSLSITKSNYGCVLYDYDYDCYKDIIRLAITMYSNEYDEYTYTVKDNRIILVEGNKYMFPVLLEKGTNELKSLYNFLSGNKQYLDYKLDPSGVHIYENNLSISKKIIVKRIGRLSIGIQNKLNSQNPSPYEFKLRVMCYSSDHEAEIKDSSLYFFIHNHEEEIIKNLYVKIKDCPVWCQEDLKKMRIFELNNNIENEIKKVKIKNMI